LQITFGYLLDFLKLLRALSRKQLVPVFKPEDMRPGKYVLYRDRHFVGLEIWPDGSCIVRTTRHKHVGSVQEWCPAIARQWELIFAAQSDGRVISNVHDVWGGCDVTRGATPAPCSYMCVLLAETEKAKAEGLKLEHKQVGSRSCW